MPALVHLIAVQPLLGMALEAALLVALIVAIRVAQRRYTLSAETSRKLFHVSGGLSTLAFPWLFHTAWPVLALAPVTVGALLALKYVRRLRGELGSVLYGIERRSLGEVYMPLGITLVWVLSGGDPLLFCPPVLMLALADPVAALVGVRLGRHRYATVDGEKSVEGSLAFCLVAVAAVLLPLLLAGRVTHAEGVLIALDVALLAMIAESVAWRGLDNLFIPLVGYALLRIFLPMHVAGLLGQFVAVCVLAGFALFGRRRVATERSAVVSATIGVYLLCVLAGW
jgi:phytol kinase